jgi:hypothetical protein
MLPTVRSTEDGRKKDRLQLTIRTHLFKFNPATLSNDGLLALLSNVSEHINKG